MKLNQNWRVEIYDKDSNELLAVTMSAVVRKTCLVPIPIEDDFKRFGFCLNQKQPQINQFFVTLEAGVFDMVRVNKVFYLKMMTVRCKYKRNNLSALFYFLTWERGLDYQIG